MDGFFTLYEYLDSMRHKHPELKTCLEQKTQDKWFSQFMDPQMQTFVPKYCAFMLEQIQFNYPTDLQNIIFLYALSTDPISRWEDSNALTYNRRLMNFDHFGKLYPNPCILHWKWHHIRKDIRDDNLLTIWLPYKGMTEKIDLTVDDKHILPISAWLVLQAYRKKL